LIAGTAISVYAYFKVIRLMYDRHVVPVAGVAVRAPFAYVGVAVCVILVIVMTFYPYTPSNVLPLAQ
jgi:NADH:ubiquinone oxidoreductase subunit 2 (subunit N)